MPVSLSQWSGEQGFKSATKPYHAVKKNDELNFWKYVKKLHNNFKIVLGINEQKTLSCICLKNIANL